MLGIRHLSNDERLASRVRTGDDVSFDVLANRYRAALRYYARKLLKGTGLDTQPVVDGALDDARAGLRPRGRRTMAVGTWLFSLTRDAAIDALRRARAPEPEPEPKPKPKPKRGKGKARPKEPVAPEEPVDAGEPMDADEPPAAPRGSRLGLRRRRRLVSELADLSHNQSITFLAREIDNRSHVSIAGQLGVSETASRILAVRARERLAGLEPAHAAECVNVRVGLEDAHRRGARPSVHVREHLVGCDECAAYRSTIGRMEGRLSVLSPGPGPTALSATARVVGGGSPAGVLAKGAALAVVIAALVAGAVALVTGTGGGASTPIHIEGKLRTLSSSHKIHGKSIPRGAALVRAEVVIPAGKHDPNATITMSCPTALRYSSLVGGNTHDAIDIHAAPDTTRGAKGSLQFVVVAPELTAPTTVSATILCVRPSQLPATKARTKRRTAPKKQAVAATRERVCATRVIFTTRPGGPYVGVAFGNDPVTRLRTSASRRYVYIRTPDKTAGWAPAAQISRRGRCP